VARGVVDALEVVEVEEHDREPVRAVAFADRVLDPRREQSPVREPGEVVVLGAERQLALQCLEAVEHRAQLVGVEHDRHLLRERLEHAQVVGREPVDLAAPIAHDHHAERRRLAQHRLDHRVAVPASREVVAHWGAGHDPVDEQRAGGAIDVREHVVRVDVVGDAAAAVVVEDFDAQRCLAGAEQHDLGALRREAAAGLAQQLLETGLRVA
jgi:hypothetical protein